MSEVRAAAPGAGVCTQCGACFTCGRDDPQGCWCAALPTLPQTALEHSPLTAYACLCSVCLRALLERTDPHRDDLHRADLHDADTNQPAAGTVPGCRRP